MQTNSDLYKHIHIQYEYKQARRIQRDRLPGSLAESELGLTAPE